MSITGPRTQPNYFAGQQLTAEILNSNLANELERRWTHNRVLHGLGIGQGLTVTFSIGAAEVVIEPGFGLDPSGHELVLTEPVTLQVPPVPGPASYVLVCRFNPSPEGYTGTGPCLATGTTAWLETPLLEFVADWDYPTVADSVLPLATVQITACAITDVDFGRRQVLGRQRLPYVDAGVHRPLLSQWEMVRSESGAEPRYGLRTVADTSAAAFSSVPNYQARLSGRRWMTVDPPGGSPTDAMLWTVDANVVDQAADSVTVEVLIPSVQLSGVFTGNTSFEEFVATSFSDDESFFVAVADELEWAISWLGVEGSL